MLFKGYYCGKMLLGFCGLIVEKKIMFLGLRTLQHDLNASG